MEFHVSLAGGAPDLDAIGAALRDLDPAALLDVDAAGSTLRIAGALSAGEVIALLATAGCPVQPRQVRQLPSICCGGCSG